MSDPRSHWFLRLAEARPSWQIGTFLSLLGALLLRLGHSPWLRIHYANLPEITSALGEALLIAGVLTLLVDPFLKARLLREASRSIFEHMIGFDNEPQLRERIRNIAFETKLYRRDYKLTCKIAPLESGLGIALIFQAEGEVLSQSLHKVEYPLKVASFEADKPSDCEFVKMIGDAQPRVEHQEFKLDNSGNLNAEAAPVEIQPRSQGVRHRFLSSFRVEAPNDYYHTYYFGLPTIDVTIRLVAPLGWKVWLAGQRNETNEMIWHTDALYMTGEKIEIHWRRPVILSDCAR
jgi:hypothetical protein